MTLAMRPLLTAMLLAKALFDPAAAGALELRTTIPSLGFANEVEFQGTLAFVADGAGGLRIFDVSAPASPVPLGSIPPLAGGAAVAVDVDGTHAYVANGIPGVQIVDVANPAAPSVVKVLNPIGSNNVVRVGGGFAYVDLSAFGLQIYDVTDPANPVERGHLPVTDYTELALRGDLLLGLTNSSPTGLRIIDVSDSDAPVQLSNLFLSGYRSLALDGDRVFVGGVGNEDFVSQVDISDPSQPTATSPASLGLQGDADGLFVSAGRLFSGGLRLSGVHTFPGSDPPLMSETPLFGDQVIEGVDQIGNLVYLATHDDGGLSTGGVHIVDVANPLLGMVVGYTTAIGRSYAIDAVDLGGGQRRAYLAGNVALSIVDVTSPATPTLLGQFAGFDAGRAVAVDGNVAYVGTQGGQLHSINVSNPAAPVQRDVMDLPGVPRDMLVAGGFAYLALDPGNQVLVVDVSDPDDIAAVATVPSPAGVTALDLADGLLYFVASTGGLRIYNVATPTAPVFVGAISTIQYSGVALPALDLDVDRRFAYVTSNLNAAIVDVRNPSAPVVLNDMRLLDPIADLRVAGGRLYGGGGLFAPGSFLILDVSNPGEPGMRTLAELDTSGDAEALAVDLSTGLVAVAAGSAGVSLVDAAADLAAYPCIDGLDNDGDTLVDHPADPGCSAGGDDSELPACSDGLDNDGDTLVDFPTDPGCGSTLGVREDPQCQDGVDNEGDGTVDHPADARCTNPRDDDELTNATCGLLGIEPLLALAIARRMRRRRR